MPAKEHALSVEQLRWCCDESALDFESTAEVEPIVGVVGQDDAVEALTFGLEVPGEGQNVYVRGLTGTGRMTLLRHLLETIEPTFERAADRCYVHNFEQPDRPRLIEVERGQGPQFRRAIHELIEFIEQHLDTALNTDGMRAKRTALEERVQARVQELGKPFEEELRKNDLAMVTVQIGNVTQPAIAPLIDGKPASPQDLAQKLGAGELSEEQVAAMQERVVRYSRRLGELNRQMQTLQLEFMQAAKAQAQEEARTVLRTQVAGVRAAFPTEAVREFLEAVIEDVVELRLGVLEAAPEFTRRYRVNLVQTHDSGGSWPVVVENAPTLLNLIGSIEREFLAGQVLRSDHLMIQGGSLLRADGGYLVLAARDVLGEPGAWKVLLRALRTGVLEIMPSELAMFQAGPVLKPEPIRLHLKVILVGDPGLHQMLDAYDQDFPFVFKVLADFETTLPRDAQGLRYYAGVLARIARDEELPPFARSAVAALAEHGARIAGERDRLTTRFGRLADLAREAAYLARKANQAVVTGEEVRSAIRRGRRRANLPARRFLAKITDGTIRIQTEGAVTGQVNGLAVVKAGPLTYGFPTRITATIGPGTAGVVNIERESDLSGAIHTKGFYILGGLLRHLLRTGYPLAFSASVAFEQSYGGIDGDSASGAEMCCLMSALTGVPLAQGIAMTGAIDQLGRIQPVGAVAEKVEGFFAVCRARHVTGEQGVIIPASNAGDLMVNHEVLEACERGTFHVYAVDTIYEALAVLTGAQVLPRAEDGSYADGSLLQLAEQRALEFWRMAASDRAVAQPLPVVVAADQS